MRFNFFQLISVGLDIADRSIEAAALIRGPALTGRGQVKVLALGRQALPAGVVERGIIKDQAKLATAVRAVLSLAKPQPIFPRRIFFGLPEAQVYLHSFTLTNHTLNVSRTTRDLEALVIKEAKENVPLDAADLLIAYQSVGVRAATPTTPAGGAYLLAATSRQVLGDWQAFFRSLGLEVEFDLEMAALFRGLGMPPAPVAVVDIGAVTTNVAVFNQRGLIYSRTLAHGAEALTGSLVKNLKITAAEAEKQKQDIGLMDPDNQLFTILLKELVPLRDELKITLDYCERAAGQKVETIYLAGGGSQLRGLADYLKSNLEISTVIARSVFLNQPLVYLEALGLALRGFAPARERAALAFQLAPAEPSPAGGQWRRRSYQLIGGLAIVLLGAAVWLGLNYYWRPAIEPVPPPLVEPAVSPEIIFAPATTTEPAATPAVETITVADTPIGWLNVRSGPGLDFSVIGKVRPGEDYPLLEETGEWYKMELGWVNKKYIIRN